MTKKNTRQGDLRKRAEDAVRMRDTAKTLSPDEAQQALYELRVHQIELEMQNEELRRTQADLEASRERYFDLYDLAPVGYFTLSEQGLILEANLKAAEMLGVKRNALVKVPLSRFILPEDQDIYYRYRKQFSAKSGQRCELRLTRNDGAQFWVRLEAAAAEDGEGNPVYRAAMSDITERKQIEEELHKSHDELELRVQERTAELKESEEKYRDLVESVNSIIIRVDAEGRVTFLNEYGQRFFGYSEEEILGKHVIGTIVPADTASGMNVQMLMEYIAKHPERYKENEIQNIRRNGKKVWVSWTVKPFHEGNGVVSGMLAAGNDISERKRLEEQLRQSHKMEAIGTLAGGIAHDFNNMLAVILGNAELALDDTSERDSTRHNLDAIFKAAKRGRDLVKQILTFSRKSEQQQKEQNLTPLIEESFNLLRASIPSTIEMKLALKAKSDVARINEVQFQQIIVNLCANAAHAMRASGGLLEISLENETLHLDDASETRRRYLKLSVRDTGTGMDEDVRKRIFDPFFTTKEPGEGTGMGLAVVYGIVEAHNGLITVHSEPGKGSVFNIFLPKTNGSAPSETQAPEEAALGGDERIMFVDDEDNIVDMTSSMLELLGYKVSWFTEPEAALDAFAKAPLDFDLVITDQTMPKMTGAILAGKLKAIRHDIPVMLCTGYSETVSAVEAKGLGIEGYVMKPLTKRELAEAIRKVLDQGGGDIC